MQAKRDAFLDNRRKRILIVISAFLLQYVIAYIIDPFAPYWNQFFNRHWTEIVEDSSLTFLFCFVISEGSIVISNKLNKRLPWTEKPGRRFLLEACMNLAMVLTLHLMISFVFISMEDQPLSVIAANASVEETRGLIQWITISCIIGFVIIAVNTGNYLILNWKNAALRATELNQIAMEAELQSLKLQIDPHFVFNNLSVLSELILEDQQLGYDYAENFSKIYRYLLVNSKKDTISLEDELKFLESYRFLIGHRFRDAISFEINVAEEALQLYMPPLTLQLLVENAIKHNKTNKKDPLTIRIYTNTQQELIVENALLPIGKSLDSSGIGIKNITRRYNLLSDKEPRIIRTDTTFNVIIPLIKLR